ncbi:MAG TPA: GNAT family N-acetyltransferase [Candidatus Limnocylindrales bacterium]|nr:GNAT family N-acetyltransferase [Candidatus Limnocylindrales bacterium]
MHHDLEALPRWGFAFPGPIRDELTALALAGTKTATAGLVVEMELDGEADPVAGERAVLLDSAEQPVAIIETTSCRVVRLADVDDAHAIDEGEGYADAAAFRVTHEWFWNGYIDDLRTRLGDPTFAITDETLISAERFRIVTRLDVPPGAAPVEVHRVAPAEVPPLAAVLARAFAGDQMMTWPLVTGDDLPARIRAVFEITDTPFAREGWMWAAGDGLGAMTLLPPGSEAREQELADACAPALNALTPDGGARYDALWAWIWSRMPREPHWLLDQLAVEPAAQGRGIGGALIRHAIATAEADGLPLVLETGREANLALYRQHGFEVFDEGDAPGGGPHVWFLRRDPGPGH